MAKQIWVGLPNDPIVADGAGVTGTTEAIIVPDSAVTLPARFWYKGKAVRVTIRGQATTAGTPGTLTLRVRYGGVAATVLAASAAITCGASKTNLPFTLEFVVVCRDCNPDSATGLTLHLVGNVECLFDAATVPGAFQPIPGSAIAAVASLDPTIAKALSVTAQWSVVGDTITASQCLVEDLN